LFFDIWLKHLSIQPNRIFTTFLYPRDSSLHRFDSPLPTIRSAYLFNSFEEKEHGLVISAVDYRLIRPERSADTRHRKTEGATMTFYILGGIVALGLMVYLVIALLKPELFS
jgi:K+-transporting ATPase KdpF subunit